MTGKRESSKPNETFKNGKGNSENSSKESSRRNSVTEPSSSEIPLPGAYADSADAVEESLQIPKEENTSNNNLQVVPVHITSNTDYNTSSNCNNSNINNSGSQYSSNSSVDSQYKYHGDRSVGYYPAAFSNGYNPSAFRQAVPYNRAPGPAIPTEQMNLNIQKNLEHCAQQQRQQLENIIRNNNEATQFLARGSLIVRMRGLPYDCTPKQVVDFFESGENGVKLHENEDGVLFVRKSDGRATGDAFVLLSTEEDVTKALTKHRDLIGSRYIELFRSTSAEVMNRSMDVRHLEQQTQQPTMPPLIALPPMLPQQSVAQGPKKDCIRLRGLPFEAGIDHVLDFLGDFAKNIMFRGVHMVYTPQGQPSGEAFIQMTSETAAWTAAHHRHNRFMPCAGKKHRYIEVFQCSGDDMNLVLSGGNVGGSPSSVTSAPPPPAPGSLVPTPGGSAMLSAYGAYPLGPAPTVLSHALPPTTRLAPYPPAIATPYPMFYWPYPSPPVSPTSGYYSSMPHHTIIPSECIPIHTAGEMAMHPGEAVATM